MSRPAGTTTATADEQDLDPMADVRDTLTGPADPTPDDGTDPEAAMQDFVEAELGRGLEDDDDEGGEGDETLSDEELAAELEAQGEGAEGVYRDEGDEEGITEDEADAGEGTAAPGEGDAGTDPAEATPGAGAPTEDAAAPAAAWEPFTVAADKETVAIEEAVVQKVAGHYMIAVPEASFARFQSRMSRGVVAEKVWRHLEAERRELAAEAGRKTQAEIEAEETLKLLPRDLLQTILDERDLELLDAKIAQRVATEGVRKPAAAAEAPPPEAAAPAAAAEPEAPAITDPAEAARVGLINELDAMLDHVPAFQQLSDDDLRAAFAELQAKNVVFQDGGEWYSNRQQIFDVLQARVKAPAATPAPAPEAASAAATAPAASSDAPTPAPRQPAATANRAETYNRGVAAGARPTTTSVKARRDAQATRPAAGATRDAADRPRVRSDAEIQAEAEAEWSRLAASARRPGSLDLDDED